MAIYWPIPGFKGRTIKPCVFTRWDFNFCARSSPLRGSNIVFASPIKPKDRRLSINRTLTITSVTSITMTTHQRCSHNNFSDKYQIYKSINSTHNITSVTSITMTIHQRCSHYNFSGKYHNDNLSTYSHCNFSDKHHNDNLSTYAITSVTCITTTIHQRCSHYNFSDKYHNDNPSTYSHCNLSDKYHKDNPSTLLTL